MTTDEKYMQRCLELAKLGLGNVQPNPMVGAVIVHENSIIGEGYHQQYGCPHAEINAINSVDDKELLKESTIYVSLEPCSHYGKTPPCADKLIEMQFPRVVVGATDPHDKVNGKGIAKLREAGIKVETHILENECVALNKRFFTYHQQQRPYVILKWAQTADGFMDIDRSGQHADSYWITNSEMRVLVHKWRSEEQAILIGYNTYKNDRPQLTTRCYPGKDPARYIAARNPQQIDIEGFTIVPDNVPDILRKLYDDRMQSVIVEGGRKTLEMFIQSSLWDEARILTGNVKWGKGLPAPTVSGKVVSSLNINGDRAEYRLNG